MKAIILAGGSGSRLWPLSNNDTPKQLLKIGSCYSLLQNTLLRLQKFISAKDILTVTNAGFTEKTALQLRELFPDCQILSEPCAKNTAPAICCALEYLSRQDGDDIVTIVPADHLIEKVDEFRQTIAMAETLATENMIVTLGIRPDYPETGFGYIKIAGEFGGGFRVEKFVEKPSSAVAREYVDSGNYFWNGGIFIGKISVFLEEFARFVPEIAALAQRCTFAGEQIDEAIFSSMPKISIDYAIMEKSSRIALVELLSDWSDLGSWQAIYDLKEKDTNGNVVIGNVTLYNVKNCLIYSPDKEFAVADAENRIFVNAGDVVMSCELYNSQNVKFLYDKSARK